jgi:predicted nucleotidyltransferase
VKNSLEPLRLILTLGFPLDRADIIHAFIGGSALHGVKLGGTDDTDVYGIYIEKPWLALGIEPMQHFVASTAPQTRRNVAGDVDVMCYSLRRWAALAAKGNPTILHSLFTPAGRGETEWSAILDRREIFLARSHARKYLGYAEAQLKRHLAGWQEPASQCHSERSEESRSASRRVAEQRIRARFLAALGMTR